MLIVIVYNTAGAVYQMTFKSGLVMTHNRFIFTSFASSKSVSEAAAPEEGNREEYDISHQCTAKLAKERMRTH